MFVLSRQTLFASADTAYVLAYSIIMLTTDLHSPQVGPAPLPEVQEGLKWDESFMLFCASIAVVLMFPPAAAH